MDIRTKYERSASLAFRGFAASPSDVQMLVGVDAKLLAQKGTQMRPNRPNTWQRSAVEFEVEFPDAFPIVEMVPALLAYTGGVEHLCGVRDQVLPEFFEINLVLPIKFSEEQEDGYLSVDTLADVSRLRTTIGFSFV